MRNLKTGSAMALAALLWLGGAAGLVAQEEVSLAGSWRLIVYPDGGGKIKNLATISADGNLTNWDPYFGMGVGSWEQIGKREYVSEFMHFVPSDEGLPPGTTKLTVQGITDLRPDGNKGEGPFVTTFFNVHGDELFSFTGIVRMRRVPFR